MYALWLKCGVSRDMISRVEGGESIPTLTLAGYLAAENLYVLCKPAVATPGLQLITAADLNNFWRSDHYGELSKGVLYSPDFVIVQ